MNEIAVGECFGLLCNLWGFEPNPDETKSWGDVFRRYNNVDLVKAAIRCVFENQTRNWKRPAISTVKNKIGEFAQKQGVQLGRRIEPAVVYYLVCTENEKRPNLVGRKRPICSSVPLEKSDKLTTEAIENAKQYATIYGGLWRVEWPEKEKSREGELTGNAARLKVEAEILAGPDCPGKRFLLGKKKIEDAKVGIDVSEILKSDSDKKINDERNRQRKELLDAAVADAGPAATVCDGDIPF